MYFINYRLCPITGASGALYWHLICLFTKQLIPECCCLAKTIWQHEELGNLPHAGMFRRLIVVFLFTFAPEEAHFEEGASRSGDYCIFPPPDGGVFHAVALEVVGTGLLQR
jgi:hypothetical protein